MHRKLIAFSRQGDSLSIYAQEIRPNTNIFGIYYVIEYLFRSGKPFGIRRKGDKCVLVVLFRTIMYLRRKISQFWTIDAVVPNESQYLHNKKQRNSKIFISKDKLF